MISQRRFDALLKRLYDGNSTIVAGVSGGPDSICMLHLLASSSLSPRVVVAHLNFSLRGEESNGDMRFVEERAKFYGFPFLCKTADTRAYAEERSLSIEIAAREIRYKWFGEILSSYAPAVLAVAHNANDNAETLLLNLLRGTGIKGLCGIAERAPLPYRDNDKYEVIRPLLSFEREEIEEYLAHNSLQARIDSTNALCDVARNRIRNIIIPQMRQINPSAVRRLNMDIANFADAYLLLQQGLSNCKESYVLYRAGGKLPLSGQSGQGVQFRSALLKRYLQLMLDGKALAAAGGTALLLELLEEFNFPATMLEEVAESLKRSSASPQCDARFWRTERYTMVDNRAKNCFFHRGKVYYSQAEAAEFATSYGVEIDAEYIDDEQAAFNEGYRWDLTWGYDFDTALGISNTGKLEISYGKEDIDYYVDGDPTSSYIFH